MDDYTDTSFDEPLVTDDSPAESDFNWDDFYNEYGDVGGGYDPATSPTDQDVLDAIDTGTTTNPLLKTFFTSLGNSAKDYLKNTFYNPTTGKVNLAGLGTAAMALYGAMSNKSDTGGYNKPVPVLTASRERIDYVDPNRRPGEAGRQYFTVAKYVGTSGEAHKQGILAAY